MTKEEEKAKAFIEKCRPITNKICESGYSSDYYAKQCATLECQSIIDELELIYNNDEAIYPTTQLIRDRITFYKGVIKAIEQQ